MKSLWLALLERAIAALLAHNWNDVVYQVRLFANSDLPGNEKRERVYAMLRHIGVEGSTWLLNAAIEIAVGKLKAEQTK